MPLSNCRKHPTFLPDVAWQLKSSKYIMLKIEILYNVEYAKLHIVFYSRHKSSLTDYSSAQNP